MTKKEQKDVSSAESSPISADTQQNQQDGKSAATTHVDDDITNAVNSVLNGKFKFYFLFYFESVHCKLLA